ncbi:hypothetical protein GGF41_002958 [Coemansia sp. RSA 2531]|nr:hypothetical protein GGF41_002958 [Coemansia sp. RSA 2531]
MAASPPLSSSSSSPGRRRTSPPLHSALLREDYDEVLESEVFIDVNRLRKYARHGIPLEIRGVSTLQHSFFSEALARDPSFRSCFCPSSVTVPSENARLGACACVCLAETAYARISDFECVAASLLLAAPWLLI